MANTNNNRDPIDDLRGTVLAEALEEFLPEVMEKYGPKVDEILAARHERGKKK
jgi:hypothetical protein